MILRRVTDEIKRKIGQVPAVALLGARQVGKTTLAKTMAKKINSIYLDLEAPEDLFKLSDPGAFLNLHNDKLVILDEIQRMPDLFPVLRGLIDKNREQGRKSGQFLFLGSASMDLLRQSSESLAGRISYIHMGGLNITETGNEREMINKLWIRGGFPESFLAADDTIAMDWIEDLIRTCLERDLPQLGFRVPAIRMRRLWTMLAHLQGEPVNHSKLGANLEIDGKTVNRYIDILTDLMLVRRLEPWYANVKKRLIKTPRYYVRDSGILHRLLGISSYDALLSNPILGKSWEGFVMENIHSILSRQTETYFYRTVAGAEIDMVIRMPSSEIWAVEIKYGTAPKLGRHFNSICDDVSATRKYCIYGGDDEFPVSSDVTVISLPRFMEKLGSYSQPASSVN